MQIKWQYTSAFCNLNWKIFWCVFHVFYEDNHATYPPTKSLCRAQRAQSASAPLCLTSSISVSSLFRTVRYRACRKLKIKIIKEPRISLRWIVSINHTSHGLNRTWCKIMFLTLHDIYSQNVDKNAERKSIRYLYVSPKILLTLPQYVPHILDSKFIRHKVKYQY